MSIIVIYTFCGKHQWGAGTKASDSAEYKAERLLPAKGDGANGLR